MCIRDRWETTDAEMKMFSVENPELKGSPSKTWSRSGPHSRAPKKIQAMEMRCYHKILRISYKDHVTNEEVRAKIQQAIGPHEDLLTIVKRRKLHWYGHVSCSSGLAKTILRGKVKGRRRQRRQKKRWEDNIMARQASSSPSPRGQWRTGKNGRNWS